VKVPYFEIIQTAQSDPTTTTTTVTKTNSSLAGSGVTVEDRRSKMTTKPEVASSVAELIDHLQERGAALPAQVREAREAIGGWGAEARRFTRNNPAAVLIGAFVVGVLLARAARHA
jgi:hypothetical protein